MKLTRIRLQNFRSHVDTTIELPQIALVLGRNNSGKSSIAAAIEFALAGKCPFTDGRGAGANALIRHGAEKAVVELDIEGLGTVRRSIPGGLEVSGWAGNQTILQAKLYETLGADEAAISAAINTSRFLEMKQDERKNLLFGLLGFSFTAETIETQLEDWAGKGGYTDDQMESWLSACRAIMPDRDKKFGPEIFIKLEKEAVAERRAAKRLLAEAEGYLASLPAVSAAVVDTEALHQKLTEARGRQEQLTRQLGSAAQAAENLRRLQGTIAQHQMTLAEIQNEYKTRDLNVNADGVEKAKKRITAVQKKSVPLETECTELISAIADLKGQKTALESLIDKLEKTDGRCPLAPEKISCQAGEQLHSMVAGFRKETEQLANDLLVKETRLKDVTGAIDDLSQEIRNLEAAINAEEQKSSILIELKKREEDAKKALERAQAELTSLPGVPSAEELEAQLAEVKREVSGIEAELSRANEVARAAWERKAAEEKVAAGREEVEIWDTLCEAFGPKGIRSQLIGETLQSLEATINERLALLTNGAYSARLDIEDGFEVLVTHDGATLPLDKLSTSERLRVGIVIQSALVNLAGIGLLIVDDADTLDLQNRQLLTGMLLAIRDNYSNVLVLSTIGEVAPRDPGIPWVGVFVVENGRARRMPAAATA